MDVPTGSLIGYLSIVVALKSKIIILSESNTIVHAIVHAELLGFSQKSSSVEKNTIFGRKNLEIADAPCFETFPSSKNSSRFPKSLSFMNRSIQFRENFIVDKISFPGKSLWTTSSATSLTVLAVIPPIKFGFISSNFQASCCSNWN